MKTIIILLITITLVSCGGAKINQMYDSEIDAIRDQTEVLKDQNKILQEISNKLTRDSLQPTVHVIL